MKVHLFTVLIATLVFTSSTWADWDPNAADPMRATNHKMHYPQMPDLSPMGLDVLAGPYQPAAGVQFYEKFLADDFVCKQSGPITDIHIWGSYNEDIVIMPNPTDPANVPMFSLVIYEDIPAGTNDIPYSRPGQPIWDWYGAPTATRVYAHAHEEFFDPNRNEIVGIDNRVWQFNFNFEITEAVRQEQGKTYWLGVKHTSDLDGNGIVDFADQIELLSLYPGAFGWKTSGMEHFQDDAVWTDVSTLDGPPHVVPFDDPGPGPAPTIWRELFDPRTGESLDLAFVITPEPATMTLLALGGLAILRRRRT